MITSGNGNQYLRPDYLSPLPTTLDAKKSPLALLAQTCSQIGADTSSNKSSPPAAPTKKETPVREKSSPGSSSSASSPVSKSSSCFKPYENVEEKSGKKTPAKKSESPGRRTPQEESKESQSPQVAPPHYLYPPYLYRGAKAECRDPYCGGCHLGKGCPAGCLQCEKTGAASPFLHAAAYAHLAALAASAAPYAAAASSHVCSWIGPDATYCGKRFSNSEELLSHLRSHTADSMLHPLLPRSYPTPPLSPLAHSRYHPYSKPLLPPSPFALPPHPALPPYLSPYVLYPPRLGASHP